MVGEILTEKWFGSIWGSICKEPEKQVIGVLAFEISRLMSKVVGIWKCLADKQIARLREEFTHSIGIQKLVSGDEDYLMDLAFAEIIDKLVCVAKSIAVLGKKCVDPTYHNLEFVSDDPGEIDPKWYGWYYRLMKMEKKVKKMEKFVVATEQLYVELEVLSELEQSLRQMKAGAHVDKVKLLEFQHKVEWQRQEVKNLQEISPWVRTCDCTVELLLRSLFTIIERIKHVYGVNQIKNVRPRNDGNPVVHGDICISSLLRIPERNTSRVPLGRAFSDIGFGRSKSKSMNRKSFDRSPSSILCRTYHLMHGRRFMPTGLTGCMETGNEYSVLGSHPPSSGISFRSNEGFQRDADEMHSGCTFPTSTTLTKLSWFNSKRHLLNAPPSSLGHAALALHYANLIIVIEKLASSPHLISLDARDDLYNLLPASIRSCLRAKLKTFTKTAYDPALATEWSTALVRILEWLSPLAHNMVRWHSEQKFVRQRPIYGSNVLLVQTLSFADQDETEAVIVELLMGLNYLYRFSKDINEKLFLGSSCSRAYDGFLNLNDNMSYKMIDHLL